MSEPCEPCEWCNQTSSDIDSLERQNENLINAIHNLIGQLSVTIKPVDADKTRKYLDDEYGIEL